MRAGGLNSAPLCGFAHAFQDYFGQHGFSADAGGEPNQLSVFLRWISPGRLVALQPLLNQPLRFAQQYRYILLHVQAFADEKRHHHNIPGLRHLITVRHSGFLFQKDGMHARVNVLRAD